MMKSGSNLEEIRVKAHSKCPFSWGMLSTRMHQKTHACLLFMKARTVLSTYIQPLTCTDHKWNRYPILCGGIYLCLTETDLLLGFLLLEGRRVSEYLSMGTMTSSLAYLDCQELQVGAPLYTHTYATIIEQFSYLHQMEGRHCCLWCLIKLDQLKEAPSVRGPVQGRTTQSIVSDNANFVHDGQNMKKAKQFNNAIDTPFFPCIPLDQVRCYIT